MNRKVAIIIILQALLIVMMFWVLVFYGKDEYEAYTRGEEDEIETPSLVSNELGITVITLSPEAQKQSDIRTLTLTDAEQRPTLSAFGAVMSIDSLIDLRSRYLSAKADASVASAALINSRQEYQRLHGLNQDDHNISDRAVAIAEAQWKADQARVAAAETVAANVRDSIRQQWGDALASLSVQQPASPELQSLLQYQEVVLQVTLPYNGNKAQSVSRLTVSPLGVADKAIPAMLVSASPNADATMQGKTYFYRAAATELRAGQRVSVQLDNSGASRHGVIVPDSAVVWYGGKAWAYRKEGADRFIRQPVDTDSASGDGWFNTHGAKAGDIVVVNGAQLLLSEEFKYQIKNENDD